MAVAYYCEVLTHVCVEKFDVDAVNATCITRRSLLYMHTHTVVKLLSKRWWIPRGARLEGQRAEVGFPTADRGCRAFKALCLAFVAFKLCLMLEFYPAEWWIPARRCLISIVKYRTCYYR